MSGVRELAAAYGVRVEIADLGDWGRVRLIAEYDPEGPVIRVNRCERSVERAIAHELYHHREAIGEIPRIRDRAAREAAADAFAGALVNAR
ncbi:MAG TPA: ImmA/IrrE family metallo-endopeptidase [Candidatus Elarobacter sp.]|nr:ImmA/IrrE family metallo-endopeptidase [Candidatus Elarobacter sp.]